MTQMKVFIGWDSREDIAFQVAKYTIQKHIEILQLLVIYHQKKQLLAGFKWQDLKRFIIPNVTKNKITT